MIISNIRKHHSKVEGYIKWLGIASNKISISVKLKKLIQVNDVKTKLDNPLFNSFRGNQRNFEGFVSPLQKSK